MKKINLKYYRQKLDYTCGPICLKMILEHSGKKISSQKIIKFCKTKKGTGTSHVNMVKSAKKMHMRPLVKIKSSIKDILELIDQGFPVLINYYDTSTKEGHYAIAVGYNKNRIILDDPTYGKHFEMEAKVLEKNWHNSTNSSKGWLMILNNPD